MLKLAFLGTLLFLAFYTGLAQIVMLGAANILLWGALL
jgi:hypothetical protein